jgi:hypothetical protein
MIDGPRDGATFDAKRDAVRLNAQAQDVWDLMRDGKWRSLAVISRCTHHPQTSVSARLRDFRKPRFGGHTVERHYLSLGLWVYRLVPNTESA